MKMLTKEIERTMPKLGSTENIPMEEKRVIVKFFTPWTQWTWWVFEGEQQEDGDWLFFGMVEGWEKEMGYFTLSELTSVEGPFKLKIERDMYYTQEAWKQDVQRLVA